MEVISSPICSPHLVKSPSPSISTTYENSTNIAVMHPEKSSFSDTSTTNSITAQSYHHEQELTDMSTQVWEFVESQCFNSDGNIHQQNITFWLRTLLQQNSDLVEVVAKLEKESKERVQLLESKLNKTANSASDLNGGLVELQKKLKEETDDKILLEEAIAELELKLKESVEDNKASELLVDALTDKNKELEEINEKLQENMSIIEEDNQNLKDYTENLRSDIDSLLKLSSRARDSGIWDPHDLNFCEVTFEQVFGSMERPITPHKAPVVRKISKESSHNSSQFYDSRSSLRSDLSDLQKKADPHQDEDISLRSDASNNKIRELRQQVLKLQKKGSEYVKEVVTKDKLIADLQTQITELNNEMDDLKNENNANLSVIQRLKDNLHETKTMLSVLEEDSCDSNYDRKVSSTASLPEIPAYQAYSSKFARSLTRRTSQSSLVQQLTDQLDIARREQRHLEQQVRELVTQAEINNTEKLQVESQLMSVKTELHELSVEHDNLKDDFRTLVRKCDERRKSPMKSIMSEETISMSKTKILHEAQKGQEALLATEERLEAAIFQLQEREKEMENVAHHLETINRQIFERDIELEQLRNQCNRFQEELTENIKENASLNESIDQQKMTIKSLQEVVEGRRKSDVVPKHSHPKSGIPLPVRVIYKDSSDLSGDEGVRSHSHTPGSFIMSSSDSFEI